MLPGLIVGGEMISSFRRNFLSGAAAFVATAALAPVRAQVTAKPKTRLVLLGTGGGPRIVAPGRSKSANLIVANGVPYVVDCGEGVAHQMVRAGVALSALRYIFITHHHSDHNLDYGNLVYDAWAAGLRAAVEAYGPPPIKAMTEAYWQLNRFDIETRIGDESRPDLRKLVTAHEFNAPGLVMQNADVRVTAIDANARGVEAKVTPKRTLAGGGGSAGPIPVPPSLAQPTAVAKPAIRTSPWRVRCFGNEGRMSPRGVGLGGMGKGVRRPVLFRGRLRCESNEHSALNGRTSSLSHRYVESCT